MGVYASMLPLPLSIPRPSDAYNVINPLNQLITRCRSWDAGWASRAVASKQAELLLDWTTDWTVIREDAGR